MIGHDLGPVVQAVAVGVGVRSICVIDVLLFVVGQFIPVGVHDGLVVRGVQGVRALVCLPAVVGPAAVRVRVQGVKVLFTRLGGIEVGVEFVSILEAVVVRVGLERVRCLFAGGRRVKVGVDLLGVREPVAVRVHP